LGGVTVFEIGLSYAPPLVHYCWRVLPLPYGLDDALTGLVSCPN
jgi:hypothetical protein